MTERLNTQLRGLGGPGHGIDDDLGPVILLFDEADNRILGQQIGHIAGAGLAAEDNHFGFVPLLHQIIKQQPALVGAQGKIILLQLQIEDDQVKILSLQFLQRFLGALGHSPKIARFIQGADYNILPILSIFNQQHPRPANHSLGFGQGG